MSVEDDADRAAFLDPDEFGVQATYTPKGGAASSIYAVFDNAYISAFLGDTEVESTEPAALCRTSDLTGTVHGGELTVGGTTYEIMNSEPDGTGMTLLRLKVA